MSADDHKRPLARHPFFGLATLVLIVLILSKAQAVLVPLALSVLIAFALTPSVRSLSRRLGHGLAVALVVIVAAGAVASFGYFLERQLVELSTQMSRYSQAMTDKLSVLRGADGGGLSGISKTVDRLAAELDHGPKGSSEVRPLQVVAAKAGALERFNQAIAPVLKPAADTVIVIVLVIFLLVRRDDVRDRIIRLAGRRHVSLTTRALDDAGQRIGRFLIVQSAINGAFGIAISLALWLIGVPFPPVWGFLAAVLRFVPFLGTILGMLLPAALAFAQLPGWSHTLAVIGVFLGLDVVVAYVVEPMVVGHRTGVSSLAMIVMAVFWTWLWGPVGLVLSTPLTVCLAVLGRQVPGIEFLAVLLGDEPPLDPDVLFYQRVLAGDEDEVTNLVEGHLRTGAPLEAFDGLMLPALRQAERDRARGEISDAEYGQAVAMLTALAASVGGEASGRHGPSGPHRVLGLPGPSPADQLVWQLLTQIVDTTKVTMETASDALVSEVLARLETAPPDLVFVTAVGPGGARHARQLCTRLLRAQPGLRIAVLRPEVGVAAPTTEASSQVATVRSLREAQERVAQVLLLSPAVAQAAPAAAVDLVR